MYEKKQHTSIRWMTLYIIWLNVKRVTIDGKENKPRTRRRCNKVKTLQFPKSFQGYNMNVIKKEEEEKEELRVGGGGEKKNMQLWSTTKTMLLVPKLKKKKEKKKKQVERKKNYKTTKCCYGALHVDLVVSYWCGCDRDDSACCVGCIRYRAQRAGRVGGGNDRNETDRVRSRWTSVSDDRGRNSHAADACQQTTPIVMSQRALLPPATNNPLAKTIFGEQREK